MEITGVLTHYEKFKLEIQKRLKEFEQTGKSGEREVFRELCYCLLTAGTSAELSLKAIKHLGDLIFFGTEEEIVAKLKECYRFYNLRGRYIFLAKQNFEKIDFNAGNVRQQLVENIKGLGMKEASHFLRNIGRKGYAILDKHILNCLFELGVLESNTAPKNVKDYLGIEKKMKTFSKDVGINFDELDLALWSWKTGKVLK